MGLGGAKKKGGRGVKVIICRKGVIGGASHKWAQFFFWGGEFIPHLVYLNYLPFSPLLVPKEFYDMHYITFLRIKTS